MSRTVTPRQREIIFWSSQGKTQVEVEEILGISKNTVGRAINTALDRTGSANITGLVALALRKGWIE
jgi:LuxR family quorum-sensing system transcriptional regulator SolR